MMGKQLFGMGSRWRVELRGLRWKPFARGPSATPDWETVWARAMLVIQVLPHEGEQEEDAGKSTS